MTLGKTSYSKFLQKRDESYGINIIPKKEEFDILLSDVKANPASFGVISEVDYNRPNRTNMKKVVDDTLVNTSKHTKISYESGLSTFSEFIRFKHKIGIKHPLESLIYLFLHDRIKAHQLLEDYKSWQRHDREYKVATINVKIKCLKAFSKSARKFGIIDYTLETKYFRQEKGLKQPNCGSDAIYQMISFCKNRRDQEDHYESYRNYAMMMLFWTNALRINELLTLDDRHFNPMAQTLMIKAKGYIDRIRIHLPDVTASAIETWLERRTVRKGPIFNATSKRTLRTNNNRLTRPNVASLLHKIAKQSGVDPEIKITPHALRRASITEVARRVQKAGEPLESVLSFSRHESMDTLLLYLKQDENKPKELSTLLGILGHSALDSNEINCPETSKISDKYLGV